MIFTRFGAIFALLFINNDLKMPRILTILPLLALLLSACADDVSRPVGRLDLAVADPSTPLDADFGEAFADWQQIIGFNGSRADYAALPAVRAFEPLVRREITSLDSVERVLGAALADFPDARLYAVVSPFNRTVVTHPDGRVFIALNHYLGSDSEAYEGFPDYLRRLKTPARLPVDVVEAVVAAAVNERPAPDAALVNRLLYRGAILDAASRALGPGTSDAVLLGMTPDELMWCRAYEARIWQTLIERKLLYSADPAETERLMRPAPRASLINPDAPGATALYIALQLARSYRDANPDEPLLENGRFNDNQSLIKSNYNPARRNARS